MPGPEWGVLQPAMGHLRQGSWKEWPARNYRSECGVGHGMLSLEANGWCEDLGQAPACGLLLKTTRPPTQKKEKNTRPNARLLKRINFIPTCICYVSQSNEIKVFS